ncbi:hypothetical protein [Aquitalea sp. ASV11]|uniref:gp53-like domain-containing protein n=1 Tax=Aquitalea sp. ASV11 TaxID=2795103 RepID=UPI0018ECA23F|nr:hypothetical protein [Aquitalea sp. ASV11]
MGNLNETANWEPGVPYFAADAILTGGPDCPDNIPIQALTNRTAFLKKQIDDAVSGALVTMTAKKLQTARDITMTGDGAWVVSFDGSGNATAAMALADSGVVAGTYPVVTVDSKGRVTAARALQSSDLPTNVVLSGAPIAPTAEPGTNTLQIANTAYVQAAIAALVASSPAALDTLNELAAALGNDPNFATTMTNLLAQKAPLASPALTGNPTAPTQAQFDNDTSIATTEFVQRALGNYAGSITYAATGNISATAAGKIIAFDSTSPITMTIPSAATVPDGASFFMLNGNSGAVTLQASAGESIFYLGDGTAKTPVLAAGGSLLLRRLSAVSWQVFGGTDQLGFSANFGSLLSATGYQKLPSGIILQWGRAVNGTVGPITITLPIAFPTANLIALAFPIIGTPTGWDSATHTGSNSLTQVAFNRRSGNGTTISATSNFDVYWLAIGH